MAYRGVSGTVRVVLAVFLLTAGIGCSSKSKEDDKKKKKKDLPPAQVDLPSPPPESAFDIKKKNPDGSFRVRGLIAHRGQYLGNDIEVKGTVTYISPECDPAEAKRKDKECPKPYMYIKDGKDAEDQLMIVGYKRELLDRAEIEKGKSYVFKGKYKELAQGFVRTESGLLLVDKVGDTPAIPPDEQ